MTLVVGDRIQETTTTTGTGTITLLGAVTQFQSFAAGVGNGNSTYYTIADQSGVNWEEGIGTYTTSGSTLTRTVLASSNAGALVNFPAGTKNVFCSYPAEAAVLAAPYAYPTISPSLNLDFANSKQLDPRITFSRLSTATYYDGQTTAMAEQNLLLQSQAFGTTPWIFAGASITTTELAPDGTSTASLMTCVGQYNSVRTTTANISGLVVGTTYTVSLWVKSNVGTNAYTIWLDGSSTSIGTITPTSTWTRYSFSFVYPSGATTFNLLQDRNASGFGSVYIWGAQLEQRSSATAYTTTTTTPITNYIPQLMTAPAGVARFDHDPLTGKSLGLLIEESRANYIGASSATITPSVASNVKITLNAAVSPLGTQTALLYSPLANGNALVQVDTLNSALLIAGNTYTFSCYIKNNNFDTLTIYMGGSGSTDRTGIYVNTNTIPFTTSTYSPYQTGTGAAPTNITYTSAGNGWYRVAFTFIATNNTNASPTFRNNLSGGIINGFSGVFIDGWQVEAGSFATSYIPTTTGSVTRSADQASMTGVNFSSWYNQDQGTLYVDGDSFASGTLANISDGGLSNYFRLASGYGSINTNTLYTTTASGKSALSTSGLQMSYSKNGAILSSAIAIKLATSNLLCLGNLLPTFSSSGYNLNGHIKKLSYYPKALSTTELQALTS